MSAALVVPEKERDAKRLGLYLARTVREYMKDPQHRKDYEAWHLKKYGVLPQTKG